ncbi:MAG TPA: hypothetical protein VGN49_06530 [Micrococcaceae bacterium]|nr:hypothetical protein [Micrococcaceae bacterium]
MAGRAIPSRLARTATVSSVLFSLAAAAHLMPGGTLPVPIICLALFAFITVPVMLLSRLRLSLPIMAALMGASQLALHTAFSALSASSGFAPAKPEHFHNVHNVRSAMAPAMATGMPSASVPMLVLHIAAAVLATVMLAKGDAALWGLARWLRPLARRPVLVALPPLPAVPVGNQGFVPLLPPCVRLPALRGPPRTASTAT